MRLNQIKYAINEGFSFNIPGWDFKAYLDETGMEFKASKADIISSLVTKLPESQLNYNLKDQRSDIIQTQPYLKSVDLSSFVDEDRLPTFANSRIYYAFANASIIDQDKIEQDQQSGQIPGNKYHHSFIDESLSTLLKPIENLVNYLNRIGKTAPRAMTAGEIWKEYSDIKKKVQPEMGKAGAVKNIDRNHLVKLYYSAYNAIKQTYELFDVKKPSSHEQYTIGAAQNKLQADIVQPVVKTLAYEFAKRVKNPAIHGQGAAMQKNIEMRDKFIDLSIAQFLKMTKRIKEGIPAKLSDRRYFRVTDPTKRQAMLKQDILKDKAQKESKKENNIIYDYVVMPESSRDRDSKNFNDLLADKLCQAIGATKVNGASNIPRVLEAKKLPPSAVKIDYDQLYEYAKKNAPQKTSNRRNVYYYTEKGKKGKKGKSHEFQTREEYADFWAKNSYKILDDILKRQAGRKVIDISEIPQDKRRFVKIFSPEGLEEASGANILLIDDNVVAGATVQLINELLRKLGGRRPNRVDVFVPLRIITGE